MGMEVHYKHISPWLLGLLARQPELVEPFTCHSLSRSREPGIPSRKTLRKNMLADTPGRSKKKEWEGFEVLDQIDKDMRDQIRAISPENAPKILNEAKSDGFSLGKYFQNVQFHISGETTDHGTSLLSRAVTGGKDIGNDVWPYGPATYLSRGDVSKVAKALSKISDDDFMNRHPAEDWDKKTTEYALFYFKEFVPYYNEAAKARHAMLVWAA